MCTEIVAHDLCIGCGLCAGVCPSGNLRIESNDFGQYAPVGDDRCADGCDLCLRVCPFSDMADDEDALGRERFSAVDGIRHRPETGYWLDTAVGYANVGGHRDRGASGGLVTWVLETLLKEGRIDAAVCAVPTGRRGALFEFAVCRTADEVRRGARSCYYPVELSGAIRHVLRHEGSYAVTALPCYAKALGRAMAAMPKLRRRVRFVLGLVCGQYKSKYFAEYLCAFGGGDPARLDEIAFRLKDPKQTALYEGIRFVSGAGTDARREGVVREAQVPGRLWSNRYFTPVPCCFCDDVFAECADATFMDAWLPAYVPDGRGHSIVIARDPALAALLGRGRDAGDLALEPLDATDVIRSQQGVVDSKRGTLREWMRLAEAAGCRVPRKRTHLFSTARLACLEKARARCVWQIAHESRRRWPESGKNLPRFRAMMRPLAARAALVWRMSQFLDAPWRVPAALVRRLRRILRRQSKGTVA